VDALKTAVIEFMDYNILLSLIDYFSNDLQDKQIHGQNISVVQSYSDNSIKYTTPSVSIEILYRKNRTLAFGDFLGDIVSDDSIIEIDGLSFEYRVQLNVYSNTRGGIHKWSSLLDETLVKGDSGIPINTYHDNGDIKQANIGWITYSYSGDVKNNNNVPNAMTYDFHTIFEVKMNAIQLYTITYDIIKLDADGDLKN
jgi:hypothetical protein